jgi:hypothetical protein
MAMSLDYRSSTSRRYPEYRDRGYLGWELASSAAVRPVTFDHNAKAGVDIKGLLLRVLL